MAYEHEASFDHPVEEVFAWHTRPGAIRRLTPPWQPVGVEKEADSLRDGQAVLRMPAGVRWLAAHQPDAYQEGRRFADRLVTPVMGSVVRWRHTHEFEADGASRSRVVDSVDTNVPRRLLEPMFAFRTRQLAGDLAALRRWPAPEGRPLTVAMTGASGLIGSALEAVLTTGGHRVIRLVRNPGAAGADARHWDPTDPAADLLDGVDALVHLAGASIAGRFSESHKAAVRDSRVGPTRRLAELSANAKLGTVISASAIGIYGADRGDEELNEKSERGDGFLADLVSDWEGDCEPAVQAGVRVVKMRTGIVQSPNGGALQLLRLLFSTGLGGRLGDGRSWMAWVGIDDMCDAYLAALTDDRYEGPINAVAPEPVRNSEYTKVLARVLHRPAVLPVPSFGPRLLLGKEGASEVAQASQRVVPARLQELGHPFRFPELEPALRHLLGRTAAEV